MTGQKEFLREVVARLDAAGIPHMIVGSVASSAHGEPRGTYDVDIVIDPSADQLDALVQSFGQDYYVSAEAARDALARRSMFNVIDPESGQKADLIVKSTDRFDVEEFARRTPARVLDVDVPISTPEDVILSKLRWSKESGSERQVRDALSVAVAKWGTLDDGYMDRWAHDLGVVELLDRIRRDARTLRGGT